MHPRSLIKPANQPIRLLRPNDIPSTGQSKATNHAFAFGPRISPSRAAWEFYPTPPEATRALLGAEPFSGKTWEPACGQGHIANVLLEHGHQVIATDLAPCWGYGETGRDFLAESHALAPDIITNPPYGRGLGDKFCKHAIELTRKLRGKVAMLLPINSLCHPIRHPFFETHPPSVIYALDECHCWPYGDAAQATQSLKQQRYCWIVWDHTYQGETRLRWLTTAHYRNAENSSLRVA
ncbi:hypothetical protein [Hyphomicrobium sp. CS1BSMeth3]|uniref:hypothetical protein n=1 Tax=Hyphomicrobium sp. CS1BSMeth3 TaxID=1892844 RepID=UPI001160955E|nr:hypothetical protein [Hyphomicrobium sp. CS1BSMeth3]